MAYQETDSWNNNANGCRGHRIRRGIVGTGGDMESGGRRLQSYRIFEKRPARGSSPQVIMSQSMKVKIAYMRDLRRNVAWLASEAAKRDGPGVIGPWIASFGRVLLGWERFDIEQAADPLPAIRQFDRGVRALREKIEWRLSLAFRHATMAMPATGTLTKSSSLLIVCQGNINRSVVAEHLFRARGFTQVRSAGLLAMSGRRPSIHAERFLAERMRIDISAFRSKSVSRALAEIGNVDLVLCFEQGQAAELPGAFPNSVARFVSFPASPMVGSDSPTLPIRIARARKHSRLFPTDKIKR
jgi:protein-tyrosine-phosphatase